MAESTSVSRVADRRRGSERGLAVGSIGSRQTRAAASARAVLDVRAQTTIATIGLLVLGAAVRLWEFNALGYNSDEAVYAGQGASVAHDPELEKYFPVFRAHPLLFQSIVSIGYQFGLGDWYGRLASIVFGVATVWLTFATAKYLYSLRAGLIAGAIMALMPYHVVVTRQVLLDGPQTFFTTLTLFLIARYAQTRRPFWMYAAGAGIGLATLSKEPTILFCGAVYAFFALTPEIRVRIRDLILTGVIMGLTILPFPLSLLFSGRSKTGGNFLAWQLFRRPNHSYSFYFETVPLAIGLAVIAAAVVGLVIMRRRKLLSWRETLLLSWIAVPTAFFELWPVKGFQYLLPTAPAIAILAGAALSLKARPFERPALRGVNVERLRLAAIAVVLLSIAIPSIRAVSSTNRTSFLAGSGGIPGGRELGAFIQTRAPEGAQFLTVGPSMANIVQFYGHRRAYGISVSTNPLHRNPAYEPVENPDRQIRLNTIQYVVWDAFSARRSRFFSNRVLNLQQTYHGRAVFTYSVPVKTAAGDTVQVPVIRVYEVRP